MSTKRKGAILLLAILFIGLGFLFFQKTSPFQQNLLQSLESSSKAHLLGTDHLGRDLGARLAKGAINSILLSGLCVSGSLALGLCLGLLSEWRGGVTEKLLLLFTDMAMAFPGIVLAIVLSALTGGGSGAVLLALIFTGWPSYFRMTRSLLRGIFERPFLEAAHLAGFPLPVLFGKYVLPELAPTLGVMVSLGWGKTILQISSLGFLGIGMAPPEPELGAMISEGLFYMRSAPGAVFLPGGLITLFVLAFLLLGGENLNKTGGTPA